MNLSTPPHFSLDATVRSSWLHRLAPADYDHSARTLSVTLPLSGQGACDVLVRQRSAQRLEVQGVPKGAEDSVEAVLRSMLGLDEDLALFHYLTDRNTDLIWVRKAGFGRFLRSATACEDLVKAQLQGTGSTELARKLSERLCSLLGPRSPSGKAAFPSLAMMAAQPLRFYEQELGAGRLAGRLHALVQRCHGSAYPEAIRRSAQPPWDMRRAQRSSDYIEDRIQGELEWADRVDTFLLSLPGIGLRAAGMVLPLCGCHDIVTVTVPTRASFRRRVLLPRSPRSAQLSENEVHKHMLRWLKGFAHYRGLALWLLLYAPVEHGRRSGHAADKNLRSGQPGILISTC